MISVFEIKDLYQYWIFFLSMVLHKSRSDISPSLQLLIGLKGFVRIQKAYVFYLAPILLCSSRVFDHLTRLPDLMQSHICINKLGWFLYCTHFKMTPCVPAGLAHGCHSTAMTDGDVLYIGNIITPSLSLSGYSWSPRLKGAYRSYSLSQIKATH